jgi:hypothetical protein
MMIAVAKRGKKRKKILNFFYLREKHSNKTGK